MGHTLDLMSGLNPKLLFLTIYLEFFISERAVIGEKLRDFSTGDDRIEYIAG